LLEAALGDAVDFAFVPATGALAIYADHDGYTTLYTSEQSSLGELTLELVSGGFETVNNYTRPSGNNWKGAHGTM